MLLTLRGTPFVYYGEEIGMENVTVPEEMLQDPARIYGHGRDQERTPMQWSHDGAFTTGKPWLPYGNLAINIEQQRNDPASLLSLYRRIIWFRRTSDALRFGAYTPIDGLPAGIYAYTRIEDDDRLLTVLNFTNEPIAFELPASLRVTATIIGTHDLAPASQAIALAGNEGRLLRLG
jgi:alpha-glucosidase